MRLSNKQTKKLDSKEIKEILEQVAKDTYGDEILDLSDISIVDELSHNDEVNITYRELFDALSTNTTIKLVNLKVIDIPIFLKWKDCFMSHLHFSIEKFEVFALIPDWDDEFRTDELIQELVARSNITIKKLSLNVSNPNVFSKWTKFLASNSPSIEGLEVRELNDEKMSELVPVLLVNKFIRSLQLKMVGVRRLDKLSNLLCKNRDIVELIINGCSPVRSSLLGFSKALSANETLEKLCIENSSMDSDHLKILLTGGLQENRTLKTLGLQSNKIDHKGMALLADFVKGNSSLRELDLSGNKEILNVDSNGSFMASMKTILDVSTFKHFNLDNYGYCFTLNDFNQILELAKSSGVTYLNLNHWVNPNSDAILDPIPSAQFKVLEAILERNRLREELNSKEVALSLVSSLRETKMLEKALITDFPEMVPNMFLYAYDLHEFESSVLERLKVAEETLAEAEKNLSEKMKSNQIKSLNELFNEVKKNFLKQS